MNVLVTSASRKVWLIQAFRRALAEEGGGRVLAADSNPLAAALYAADVGLVVPDSQAPEYLEFLLALCQQHRVDLLIPTRDEELPWFARFASRFAAVGTRVMVSSPEAVDLCQDKVRFITFCRNNGYRVPYTYDAISAISDIVLPVFVKPRHGKGGSGARRIDERELLARALAREPNLVVQELISLPEYTLDVFADFSGEVLSVVARQRVRVSAGESVIGVTVLAPPLLEAGKQLCEAIGLVGHVTVQCFFDGEHPLFIEVNPRFGGGAALGFAAGANTPRLLVRLLAGQPVQSIIGQTVEDLYMLRYSQDFFVQGSELCHLPVQ